MCKQINKTFLLEFLDLCKTCMEELLTALQLKVMSVYECVWALLAGTVLV